MSMGCNESDILTISIEVFGTEDYQAMLAILPPYDGMVRDFYKRIERLKMRKGVE